MAEEVDTNLDERVDLAAEGLRTPDEADLAQDLEDRLAAASPTEPAAEEVSDFLTEKFIYTDPQGNEVELTGQELLEAREREAALKVENEELKARVAEQPKAPVQPPAEVPATEPIAPVQWDKVGGNLQEMLEEGRAAEIGPALDDVIHRTFLTSPYIANVLEKFVATILDQRDQGKQAQTKFQEFVGDEIPATEIKAFMAANSWATSEREAAVGIKAARLEKEIADLKAGKTTEVEAAKKVGAKETIQSLKAKGQLRRVGGGGAKGTSPGGKPEFNPKDPNQRLQGAVALVDTMRRGRT